MALTGSCGLPLENLKPGVTTAQLQGAARAVVRQAGLHGARVVLVGEAVLSHKFAASAQRDGVIGVAGACVTCGGGVTMQEAR